MANEEHLAVLRQGSDVWNDWRAQNPDRRVDLRRTNLEAAKLEAANLEAANLWGTSLCGADLYRAKLRLANLGKANLKDANLEEANLGDAYLGVANLEGANLDGANLGDAYLGVANLRGANLHGANLHGSNLREADLRWADLWGAILRGADLSDANLLETAFVNVNLTATKGLDTCMHHGPSVLDHRTLQRSGRLPLVFLRGCGLPDRLIDYLPSLFDEAIQYYSCFISYSSKDEAFAKQLHADLQNTGVRCWFAPQDLPIGAKTWDAIDAAIRVRDKVLLILSKNAIASDWVEDEVGKAFAEERRRNQTVLFPVRIDETVMDTGEPWAVKLRDQRNIGDFRQWKEHDAYQQAFSKVLRDLKAAAAPASP